MRNILFSKFCPLQTLPLIVMLLCNATIATADTIPKIVYLIIDNDALIVSNIKFNRFDDIKLLAKETIKENQVGNAVAVVITNKRIIAYSVDTASWRTLDLQANEKVENVSAEDYSALVVTSKRILSFNGRNGVWAQTQRSEVFH